MSLIVQVNSGGGAGAAAPPQSNATPTATPVVVATTPSPAAEPPILQNSLATLVAAAEQQQQQQKLQQQNVLQVGGVAAQRITAASLSPAHLVQHHPPPLRMVQISAPPPTVALPTAPAPIRHALPQSPVGRPLPQLPRSPLKQNQLQAVQRTVVQHQARPPISPVTVSFITLFFPHVSLRLQLLLIKGWSNDITNCRSTMHYGQPWWRPAQSVVNVTPSTHSWSATFSGHCARPFASKPKHLGAFAHTP